MLKKTQTIPAQENMVNLSGKLLFTILLFLLSACGGDILLQVDRGGAVTNLSFSYRLQIITPVPSSTAYPTPTQDIYIPASQTPMPTATASNTPIFATNTPTPTTTKIVTYGNGVNVRVDCGQFYRKTGTLFYGDRAVVKQIVYNDRGQKWYWVQGINRAGVMVEGCSIAGAFG